MPHYGMPTSKKWVIMDVCIYIYQPIVFLNDHIMFQLNMYGITKLAIYIITYYTGISSYRLIILVL